MLYLQGILADIGDTETVVVSKAHQKMTIFLTLMLDLLDNANPTSQRPGEDADGVILLDQVAVTLFDDTQSIDVIAYSVIEIDKSLHILIRDF